MCSQNSFRQSSKSWGFQLKRPFQPRARAYYHTTVGLHQLCQIHWAILWLVPKGSSRALWCTHYPTRWCCWAAERDPGEDWRDKVSTPTLDHPTSQFLLTGRALSRKSLYGSKSMQKTPPWRTLCLLQKMRRPRLSETSNSTKQREMAC